MIPVGKHAGKWNGGAGRGGGKHELVRVGAPELQNNGDGQARHQERAPEPPVRNREDTGEGARRDP